MAGCLSVQSARILNNSSTTFDLTAENILVAIDGSRHSDRVIRFGILLAKATNSAVVLLYVVPEYIIASDEFPLPKTSSPEASIGDVAERVVGRAEELITGEGVECEVVSEFGNPTSKILATAESKKVTLIVVGIHGLHRLGMIRSLGSVARRVVENSSVPVVMVP